MSLIESEDYPQRVLSNIDACLESSTLVLSANSPIWDALVSDRLVGVEVLLCYRRRLVR